MKVSILKILMAVALLSTVALAQQQYVTVAPVDSAAVTPGKTSPVKIDFRVNQGFHVNSNKPNSELLIPTELKFSLPTELIIAGVSYPAGQQLTFPFMPNEPLSVYSGDFEVLANVRASQHAHTGTYRVHAQLKYQACNDRQCFAPKSMPVDFDVKVARTTKSKARARQVARAQTDPIYLPSLMKVIVIIPAAGLGTRMGSSTATAQGRQRSKQFVELDGSPILIHTLRKFTSCEQVDEIWIAMRKSEIDAFLPELHDAHLPKPVHTVEGGEHRQQSVANAIRAVKASEDDIVLVHDAVRPFIDVETIEAAIEAVKKHGAMIVGVPAIDTIKQVERTADGAIVKTTIPRELIVQAQTPQGARYEILRRVIEEAEAAEFLGTDEASLLERAGYPVHVVMGSSRNIKITTPADLELAEFFLSTEHGRDVVTG